MMSVTRKKLTEWQISVLPDVKKSIIVTVTENCTTAELYDELKKHPLTPVADQHILISHEGELEYDHRKHLSDYDIVDRGTVRLMVRLKGGVWPSVEDLEERQRHLKPSDNIRVTTSEEYPDVFGLDDDTPRAIMACGHAVAPLSLALHCYHELERGEESIKCPDRECGSRWKFSQIREAACLSEEESQEFEQKALFNGMRKTQDEVKSCPKCSAFCIRSNDEDKRIVCSNCTERAGYQYEFCWICHRQWIGKGAKKCGNPECGDTKELFYILENCMLKILNGVECPCKRACPKCFTLIEHVEKCKHMICVGCKHEFCFICLEPYPCETDVWEACVVAPRQAPIKIRSTTTDGRQWLLFVRYEGGVIHLFVPEDCFVDEFMRILYDHPRAPKVCGYHVIFGGAQLDNRKKKRLSEYGMHNNCTLNLLISLRGG